MQVLRQYHQFQKTAPSHPSSTQTTKSTPLDLPDHPASNYVAFTANDPSNPQNWSRFYKSIVIGQISFLTLSLTFASSVSSAAASGALAEFGKDGNKIGGVATTGAFVVGIGLGAMPFAPLSECTSLLPHLISPQAETRLMDSIW
jgi:DHA1 family multidrug resistance protein-like MFS transporter